MKRKLLLALLLVCAFGLVFAGCKRKGETEAARVPGVPSVVQEIEPNDDESTAQLIMAGDTVTGNFSTEDDVDFFKFVLTRAGMFTAWTESDIDIYTLDINIYDEDGSLDDYFYGEYISGWEGDRMVEAFLEPGTYFIELEGYEEGNYTLKTQFEPESEL